MQQNLEECGIKDGSTINVEFVDKVLTQSVPRPKRPAKEEPKFALYFTVRSGNPEEDVKQIQGQTQITKSLRLRQLKKNIQDDLGIQDKVTLKLYLNGEELNDDKLNVEDANLLVEGN